MTVRMLARPSGEDKFEVSIAGTSFGLDGWRPTDNVQRLEMKPPHYPRDVVRGGGQGTAYLVFKVGRQGAVEDVVVERVNLSVYASKREMDRFQIGRAHVCTPGTNASIVSRLLLENHTSLQ